MMLYNVFYQGNTCDFNRALPKPSADISYAENTNWDRHVLRPVRMRDGSFAWAGADNPTVRYHLHAPDTPAAGTRGRALAIMAQMRLLSGDASPMGCHAAELVMLAEDVRDNESVLPAEWRMSKA